MLEREESFILKPKESWSPHSVFLRWNLLCGLSQWGFDQMHNASATMIYLCHFFPSQLLFAAHWYPGIPWRLPNWQHHKSHSCIKNTLGQRKKLSIGLSDRTYILWKELRVGIFMHHHCHFDNVVTYGHSQCTTKHFPRNYTIWMCCIYKISKNYCTFLP